MVVTKPKTGGTGVGTEWWAEVDWGDDGAERVSKRLYREMSKSYWKLEEREPLLCSGGNSGNTADCGNVEKRKYPE